MNVSRVWNEKWQDFDDYPTIGDMAAWQTGYTVPWAYDERTKVLDLRHWVSKEPGGTATLFIARTGDGMFVIDFDADGARRRNRCPGCQRYLFDDLDD